MKALQIHAGRLAKAHLMARGLAAADVRVIAAAAGGPKGLILGALDRFIFGQWLGGSGQSVDLVGASIGAWRMATACMREPALGFERLERDYIRQDYDVPPGRHFPSADEVSEKFGASLEIFYAGQVDEVLAHPRYRLHVIASRGRNLLAREGRLRMPLGYAAAYFSNLVRRKAMGAFLERVVFSSRGDLPFRSQDYLTRQVNLTPGNFSAALQASCSIPFVLRAVQDVPGAPPGAYWDGGITDYHLHLDYKAEDGIVLYPHFQKQVIPGWLDKSLKWRHRSTPFLDRMIVLSPRPEWVAGLPRGKLPDRKDFAFHGRDLAARVAQWQAAADAAQALADEFAAWLERPDLSLVQDL